ncbi:unnamed protein product [Rangifer tarandus platyrhynchus]|uniref:Uncharacterized protein n=1 Tax=Rangifer tarandus platyrhynchus TaxID=3082113 RepID=A0ABN8YQW7_RANTA|nr:unnamed protein product [Rangifer tarandus platyrhynchus]
MARASGTHFDPHSPPVVELPDSGSEPVKSHGAEKVKLTLMDGGPLNWWWSGTPAGSGGVLEISPTLLFQLLLPLKPNQKNFQFSWLQSQAVDYLEACEGAQPPRSQQGGVVRVRARGSGCTRCWHPAPPSLASSPRHRVSCHPASPRLSGQKGRRLHTLTVRKALLSPAFAEWMEGRILASVIVGLNVITDVKALKTVLKSHLLRWFTANDMRQRKEVGLGAPEAGQRIEMWDRISDLGVLPAPEVLAPAKLSCA